MYEEPDIRYRLTLYYTGPRRYAVLCVAEILAYEYYLIDLDHPEGMLSGRVCVCVYCARECVVLYVVFVFVCVFMCVLVLLYL